MTKLELASPDPTAPRRSVGRGHISVIDGRIRSLGGPLVLWPRPAGFGQGGAPAAKRGRTTPSVSSLKEWGLSSGVSPEASPTFGARWVATGVGAGRDGWVRLGCASPGVACWRPRQGVPGVPVISAPRRVGHGVIRQAVRWTQSSGRPRPGGGHDTAAFAACPRSWWCHAAGSRQRMWPSRSP
jgi:hypothetical protein